MDDSPHLVAPPRAAQLSEEGAAEVARLIVEYQIQQQDKKRPHILDAARWAIPLTTLTAILAPAMTMIWYASSFSRDIKESQAQVAIHTAEIKRLNDEKAAIADVHLLRRQNQWIYSVYGNHVQQWTWSMTEAMLDDLCRDNSLKRPDSDRIHSRHLSLIIPPKDYPTN